MLLMKKYIKEGLKNPIPSHRDFFKHKFRDNKYKVTKDGIYTRLQSLRNYHTFDKLLCGKSTINLSTAINSGKVLIFNLSKGRMGDEVSKAIGKLMIANFQSIALRREEIPKKFRKKTYLFVDEFQNFITPRVEEILTESRKYALHLVLANQVVGQKMDADGKITLLGNTALKVVGNAGRASLDIMSREILVPVKTLQKTPKYNFYVYNKDTLKPAFKLKTPTFLLDTNNHFYLSKSEYKELLHYLVFKSGYYKKIDPTKSPSQDDNDNGGDKIKPKFRR